VTLDDAQHRAYAVHRHERAVRRTGDTVSVPARNIAESHSSTDTMDDCTLGLESGAVRVVSYNPAWPRLFEAESRRLATELMGCGIALQIEHSGSTSVPGLAAKPVLDMLAGRTADSDRTAIIDAISNAGYSYRGEQGIPGRDFFRRGSPRQYHLHLTIVGSTFWSEHRAFRDYLRSHPDAARAYAELKQRLAERYPRDREAYTNGKTDFIRSVIR
jgi:GrpB-like predicted nucleotidyltransferase (UPF0157 family)